MRVRSLFALVTALSLTIGPVQVTQVQAAPGLMQLISAQQMKADADTPCVQDAKKTRCDVPKPPAPEKPKGDKKVLKGTLFNESGQDMVYCLPPTC